jgi:PAS domain S-box-containing protein
MERGEVPAARGTSLVERRASAGRRRSDRRLRLIGEGRDSVLRTVVVAVVAAAIALVVKVALNDASGQDVGYSVLVLAVATAAVAAGFWAGILTAVLGSIADILVFRSSGGTFFANAPGAFVRFVIFVPTAIVIAWLVAATRLERERARASAERFSRLIDDSPDFIVVVDEGTGRIELANVASTEFGWQPGDLIGLEAESVIPGLAEIGSGAADPPTRRAMNVISSTGDARPVEVLTRRIDLGRPGRRLLVSARDVSERAEASARLMRLARVERARAAELRAVIEAIDDGVGVFGPDGEVVLVNDGMTRLVGPDVVSAADLLDRLGMTDEDASTVEPGVPAEVHRAEPDRWVEVRRFVVPPDDGADGEHPDEASNLIVVRDTTAERATREARETFLGILSHELRTPVTSILGIAHILSRPDADLTDVDRRDLSLDVAEEAERLHHLIEDLLVLSRAEGGRLEFEPEPLLIQHAIRSIALAEARRWPNVRFSPLIPTSLPPIAGDRTYVEQVLRNLIGNAGKYSPEHGAEVVIEATAADDEIVVRVLDRGPGFSEDDADRLFDIFFRSSSTSHTRSGAGIGLFVTKSLVEMMGGRAWASRRDGGGSEFGFALPVLSDDEVVPGDPAVVSGRR